MNQTQSARGARLVVALTMLMVSDALAQSGATLTPDRLSYMVNKDLGSERWTINLNLASSDPPAFLNATGNVFLSDGSPPTFVLCQLRPDSTGTLDDPSSQFRFTCRGTNACEGAARDCARDDWRPIADDVAISADFFLPPGGNGSPAGLAGATGLDAARASLGSPLGGGAPRGATLTYDGSNFLANKDLAGERWSVSLNYVPVLRPDGTFESTIRSLTGNVYKPDGSPPSFIYCEVRPDSTGTLDDPQSNFRFSCQGTSACEGTAEECATAAWLPLGDDIALPASFLLPPGGLPASPQSDSDLIIIGRTSDPPSIITPDFTLDGGAGLRVADTGVVAGGRCPVDERCLVVIGGCSSVLGRVVAQGPSGCGCLVENVPSECITCGGGASGTCGGSCDFGVGSGSTARGTCLPFAPDSSECACYAIGAGQSLAVESCGGAIEAGCPSDRCCVDDPRDGCDQASGVACTGICVVGDECSSPGDCVDASGTYSARSTSSGICQSPVGPVQIPSSSQSSTIELVQEGCELTARFDGEPFATGDVAGDRVRLSGAANSVPIEGCSQPSGAQTYSGTIDGDDLELSGEIQTEVSCDFGDVSCTLDVAITAQR